MARNEKMTKYPCPEQDWTCNPMPTVFQVHACLKLHSCMQKVGLQLLHFMALLSLMSVSLQDL